MPGKSHNSLFLLIAAIIISLIMPVTVYGSETVIYSEGFEDGNGGYTADGNALWEWGTPSKPTGPPTANSGSKCWGTISTSTVAGSLEGNIYSPVISVPALTAGQVARVRFSAYVDINYEQYGEGDFYISEDGMLTWRLLGRFYEKMSGGWQRYVFNVSEYAGKNVTIRFRVYMQNTDPGLYIDDVALTVEDVPSPAVVLTLEANEDPAASASCPWVYTWDGAEFVRDNDIYSVARYPAGEMIDYYLLQKPLVAQGNQYKLEIREVESEDSWTDFIGLLAVDHHPDVAVAPDGKGKVLAYRPAHLVKPLTAVSNNGGDLLAGVSVRDNSGFKAYSGDYVELDFGAVDVSNGARVLLRVKGFLQGEGEIKPFTGPPAIVVQVRDSNAAWQEVGRLNPRFDWSEGAFDLSPHLPGLAGNLKIKLASISHDIKYHEIDFVAVAVGPQPKVTVTSLQLQAATLGGADVLRLLSFSDNEYVQMGSGNKFSVSFADQPQQHGLVRDFILVSEGYYVPKSDTYFVYTWDGAHWVQRDSYSFTAADTVRTFDLSSVLPDPAGEYKVRIWQDYSNWAAAIDFVGLQVGTLTGVLDIATDLRNSNNIFTLVQSSDDSRLEYPRNSLTKDPRNRWTEYKWTGLPVNIPPEVPAGMLTVQGDTIYWTYHDSEGNPQTAFDVQVWTGPGGTGKCMWSSPTVMSATSSVKYGGAILTYGTTYYVRVRLNDGISWGVWAEALFIAQEATLNPTVIITAPANGASFIAPASLQITTSAMAGAGATVSRVDFYAGTTLLGSATASPYSFTWSNVTTGNYTLSAQVTDTLGATATSTPVVVSVEEAALHLPWATRDIGNVGLVGSAVNLNGTFSLSGSGADIWGTADAFRYVYQPLTGDGQIIARVASLQNTNIWAKGGVMIRETLAANSSHALMALAPGIGATFQRRLTTGGISVNTTGPRAVAPYWLKLVRSGNTFSGYISSSGVNWTPVGSETIAMAGTVYFGLAVTSHNNAVLCAANMDGIDVTSGAPVIPPIVNITAPATGASFTSPASIAITATATAGTGAAVSRVDFYAGMTLLGSVTTSPYSYSWNNVPAGNYSLTAHVTDSTGATANSNPVEVTVAGADALPSPWVSQDIGNVGLAGSAAYLDGTFSLSGSGADIWGTADAFRYVYQPLAGDGQIIARVTSLQNTNIWAKGGVMIRETLAANSSHALMALAPGIGATFQRRLTTGGLSVNTTGPRAVAPYWLKLVRSGNTLSGYISSNSVNWTLVGSETIAMAGTVYVGLAVASHNNTVLCAANMDGVNVVTQVTPPTVHITSPASGASFTAPAVIPVTVTATSGAGVTVSQVDFYAGTTLVGSATASPYSFTWNNVPAGSYSLTAQVTDSLGAKATSSQVVVDVTPPAAPPTVTITAPANGATFTAPASITIAATATAGTGATVSRVDFYNGTTLVGSATASPYSFAWNNVPAGSYSLTAQVIDSLGAVATSTPVGIAVTGSALPPSWSTRDIGNVGLAGSAVYLNGTFSLSGSGADIWGTADAFRYVYQPLAGDGQIIARVTSLQNTNIWAKGGVMIRETLAANSSHALMALAPGIGATFQRRPATGGISVNTTGPRAVAPYWVKLVRSGNTFSGYISSNGVNWTLVGSETITMANSVYIGLAVTSHNNTALCAATLDGVQ